jgi:hypothetical protein
MKKFIMGLVVVGAMLGLGFAEYVESAREADIKTTLEDIREDSQGSEYKVESNVGNGERYSYVISAVIDDEVYGIPLDKISSTNKGIFLYKNEIGFEVGEGDKIVVVWGEEEDIFQSIERGIVAEDGSIVPESFYN